MNIASLVLRARPDSLDTLEQLCLAIPGVEVQLRDPERGQLIVTVEDGEGYSTADSILAVTLAPPVMSATLAYEYTDEGLELQEA